MNYKTNFFLLSSSPDDNHDQSLITNTPILKGGLGRSIRTLLRVYSQNPNHPAWTLRACGVILKFFS